MFKKLAIAAVVVAMMAVEAQAAGVTPVAWRGGYRYRRFSAPATSTTKSYSGGRSSSGRSSALDYPSYTQPYATRTHQWNKYPNQPYYLRGERKSLLILP
jgi:hypothetical protein